MPNPPSSHQIKTNLLAAALVLVAVCFVLPASAQLPKADKLFEHFEYDRAIPAYLRALKKDPSPHVLQRLGDCYRLTQNYQQAELFYKRALEAGANNKSLMLAYGEVLKARSKESEARELYVVFSTSESHASLAHRMVQHTDVAMLWETPNPAYSVRAATNLNTGGSEFCAVPYQQGIAFVSDRDVDYINNNNQGWNGNPFLSIYTLQPNRKGRLSNVTKLPPVLNGRGHSGPVVFAAGDSLAVFTHVPVTDQSEHKPQLFFSKRQAGKWQKPQPFEHNNAGAAFAHPALSADGQTLVFVSDMPGGQGGKDLYRCTKTATGWSQPENLGSAINTEQDEQFPTLVGNTLYFASNGHVGLGGLDVFAVSLDELANASPQNLRQPINSPYDDFGFAFTSDSTGYVSSNRKGGSGMDDLYAFDYSAEADQPFEELNGVFLYSELQPAENARITLLDANNVPLAYTFTSNDGQFEFTNLPPGHKYFFKYDESDPHVGPGTRIYLVNNPEDVLANIDLNDFESYVYNTLSSDENNQIPLMEASDPGLELLNSDPLLATMQPMQQSVFGQLYKTLPGDAAVPVSVELQTADGETVEVATTDGSGAFSFSNLSPDKNYLVKLNATDAKAYKLLFTDKQGDFLAPANRLSASTFSIVSDGPEPLPTQTNALKGVVFARVPGDAGENVTIQLLDAKGKPIRSTQADAYGNFTFSELKPDQNYLVALPADAPPNLQVWFADAQGKLANQAAASPKGFEAPATTQVLQSSSANMFGQLYKTLPGDVPPGMQVFLLNDEGLVVGISKTDAYGRFEFSELQPQNNYLLRTSATDDSNLRMLLLESTGSLQVQLKHTASGFTLPPNTLQSTENATVEGYLYSQLPGDVPPGMQVQLVDDQGNIIRQTTTDANGRFEFERLPPDQHFLVQLATQDNASMNLMLLDKGHLQRATPITAQGVETTASINPIAPKAEGQNLRGMVYTQLPGDAQAGMPVQVLNDQGEVLFTTYTDANGNFEFERLPPDENYLIKVVAEDVSAMKLAFTNDEGNVTGLAKQTDAGFEATVAQAAPATQTLRGTVYENAPGDVPEGTPVHLTNAQGEVLLTAYTNAYGEFEFERLPPDQHYLLKLDATDTQAKMLFKDERGAITGLVEQSPNGFVVQNTAATADANYESIRGKLYQYLPGDVPAGMPIMLLDDTGAPVLTTITDSKGNFAFYNLPADANYTISPASELADLKLVYVDEQGKLINRAARLENGFAASTSPKQPTETPSVALAGKLESATEETLEGRTVNLVDAQGNVVYTTQTDMFGGFQFERLPPDLNLTLQVADAAEDVQMAFLKPDGQLTKPVPVREATELELAEIAFEEETTNEPEVTFEGELLTSIPTAELAGKRVDVVDKQGNVISSAYVDEFGRFKFEKLPPDTDFSLRLEDAPEDVQMAFLKPNGAKSKPVKLEEATTELVLEEIGFEEEITNEPEVTFEGELLTSIPTAELAGKRVDVVDKQGNVISSAYVDEFGRFKFEKLPPDTDFSLRLEDAPEDVQMAFLKPNGAKSKPVKLEEATTELVLEEIGFEEETINEPEVTFEGELLTSIPTAELAGKRVDVVDKQGNVISSAYVDEFGRFKFEKLPPDTDFSLRLEDAPEDVQMAFLKPNGAKSKPVKLEEATTELVLEEIGFEEETTNEPEVTFEGELLTSVPTAELAGKRMDVVDKQGNVISSAYVDEFGRFKFEKLPPDTDFSLRLEDAPEDVQMAFLKPNGAKSKPVKLEEATTELVLEEIGFEEETINEPEIDIVGRVTAENQNLAGKRIDVVDQSGEVLFSAFVDENGFFKFENLPPDEHYLLRLSENDVELNVSLLQNGRYTQPQPISATTSVPATQPAKPALPLLSATQLPNRATLRGTLAANNLPAETQQQLVVKLGYTPKGSTRSCATKGTNRFAFLNLDPRQTYYLWLDPPADSLPLTISNIKSPTQTLLPQPEGYYVYTPDQKPSDLVTLNPTNKPQTVAIGTNHSVPNILYRFDATEHSIRQNHVLDGLAELLAQNPNLSVHLTGHTDQHGPETYNQSLSEARANSAKAYLVQKGIDAARITTDAKGESEPLIDCENQPCKAEDHAQNRRTEFQVRRQ